MSHKYKLDITQSEVYNRRLDNSNDDLKSSKVSSSQSGSDSISNWGQHLVVESNGLYEELVPKDEKNAKKFSEYSDINDFMRNGYRPLPYPPPNWTPQPPFKDEVLAVMSQLNSLGCSGCDKGFEPNDQIINSNGEVFHPQCFVCAQCFKPFEANEVYYEYDGRKYCEHDFQVLYAPFCGKCGEFIIGRVIKALNCNWHPLCFRCDMCNIELADQGFFRHAGKALCRDCHAKVKAEGIGKYVCHKCHGIIDDGPLRFRGEVYHPYHFNCAKCNVELTSDAREVTSRPGYTSNEVNELYCLRCHDNMGIPICGACRRPIEERIVTALGKHWHVEHFVCAKCEKPFMGNRHYEKKGLAYCETHYHQLFGNLCFVCNQVISGDVFTALNKAWCVHHFSCSLCDVKMNQRTKFFEMDLKPVCKKCYERLPSELRKRLKKYHDLLPKIKTYV